MVAVQQVVYRKCLRYTFYASQNRGREVVQGYYDRLADWISTTEESKPNFSTLLRRQLLLILHLAEVTRVPKPILMK